MFIAIHNLHMMDVVALANTETVTSLKGPYIIIGTREQKGIQGIARCIDLIAKEREMGIVGIPLQHELARWCPSGSQIEAVFILGGTSLAETSGMAGCIAFVIVAVKQHQAELISSPEAGSMDSS